MPPFPTNALPSEFQEEHGSLELDGDDDKATPPGAPTGPVDYDVDDEDLNLSNGDQRVWLCKVSKTRIELGLGSVPEPRGERRERGMCGLADY